MTARIRLYVEHPLGQGQTVPLDRAQAHYLFGVMRLKVGADILVFDGQNGEWLAQVAEASKRGGFLTVKKQTAALHLPPDLWLLFAPVKKANTDFIVEKAVEMGVRRLVPVQTEYTNAGRIQRDRLQAHVVEATEQCGATYLPEVAEMHRFDSLLNSWEPPRKILFCNEKMVSFAPQLPTGEGPWAVLIGPEGGFSDRERERLAAREDTYGISLGPRILRAETAAVAALTLWQHAMGDWK